MKISPARVAAFEILLKIETEKAFSSILLPRYEDNLDPRDRGLCHELALGVLRTQIRLDRLTDAAANSKRLDPEVRVAIRLGLYQLLYLDRVPSHSAVNESVDLVKLARKRSATGLVNAILRRVAKDGPQVIEPTDEIDRISLETSHPRSVIVQWIRSFGTERAESIARANNTIPAVCYRVLRVDERVEELVAESRMSGYVEGAYIYSGGGQLVRELAEESLIYTQDEGSQLVGAVASSLPGRRSLDVCAAPGGKTGQIAAAGQGRVTIAGDIHLSRAKLLRENCERQGVNVHTICYDAASALPFADAGFDIVLVDAPCSGTGTIRHNPELRYYTASRDLLKLQHEQLAILDNASKLVRPGGMLIYSTCSLEREENENVCSRFLSDDRSFSLVPPDVSEALRTTEGFARTWPDRDGMDGFFLAQFRRGS